MLKQYSLYTNNRKQTTMTSKKDLDFSRILRWHLKPHCCPAITAINTVCRHPCVIYLSMLFAPSFSFNVYWKWRNKINKKNKPDKFLILYLLGGEDSPQSHLHIDKSTGWHRTRSNRTGLHCRWSRCTGFLFLSKSNQDERKTNNGLVSTQKELWRLHSSVICSWPDFVSNLLGWRAYVKWRDRPRYILFVLLLQQNEC